MKMNFSKDSCIETNNEVLKELTESNKRNILRYIDCLSIHNNLKMNNYECITFD